MAAHLTQNTSTSVPTGDDLVARLEDAGLEPRTFSNAAGDRYDWHEHDRHKILFCAEGAITFHTREGDHLLEAGDRIDIEPGTSHAAHVHGEGVTCVEAFADDPEVLPPGGLGAG